MPKLRLTQDQLSELIDTLTGEIEDLRRQRDLWAHTDPDSVESKHRESVLLEILEILEDAV